MGEAVIVRMRGLPYDCTAEKIVSGFFLLTYTNQQVLIFTTTSILDTAIDKAVFFMTNHLLGLPEISHALSWKNVIMYNNN